LDDARIFGGLSAGAMAGRNALAVSAAASGMSSRFDRERGGVSPASAHSCE
jgi:hypothetical protein